MSQPVAAPAVKVLTGILFCLLVVQIWSHFDDHRDGRTVVSMAMQVDSMKNQLDVAQWYTNRLQNRLDSIERACKRRRK